MNALNKIKAIPFVTTDFTSVSKSLEGILSSENYNIFIDYATSFITIDLLSKKYNKSTESITQILLLSYSIYLNLVLAQFKKELKEVS